MTATLQPLTDRQREVLDFIRTYIVWNGYSPAVRDIGAYFSIGSPNGVECHLKALEKRGYITRAKGGQARSIRLTGTEKRRCPHCGKEID